MKNQENSLKKNCPAPQIIENGLSYKIRTGYQRIARELVDLMIVISADGPICSVIDGLMRTGKSTLAKYITEELRRRNRTANDVIELDYFLYDSHTREKWEMEVLRLKKSEPDKVINVRPKIYRLTNIKRFLKRLQDFLRQNKENCTFQYIIKKAYHRNIKMRQHRVQPKRISLNRQADLLLVNEYSFAALKWLNNLNPIRIRMIGNIEFARKRFLKRSRKAHQGNEKLIERRWETFNIEKQAWDRYAEETAFLVQSIVDVSSEYTEKWTVRLLET
jgi:hypothetical protein